jgi:hypothetical protein
MREEGLSGGNLNPVVRVGETVRRATGAWTPAVHQLLKHLEDHGFRAAPRVLGVDGQGREMLTFIEGVTDSSGDPAWVWSERALVEAARLVRRYHDISRSFQPPADAHWQVVVGAPTEGAVICHNDLAPYNTVYRGGIPVGLLDWDFAAPGPPLWDIAHAAYRFVPLYSVATRRGWPSRLDERAARLRLFCDTYDLAPDQRAQLVAMIMRRIQSGIDTLKARGEAGQPGWAEMWQVGTHAEGALRDLAYVTEHRRALSKALV